VAVKSGRNYPNRYYEEDADVDTLELPTFGDWKGNLRLLRHNRNNTFKLNSI